MRTLSKGKELIDRKAYSAIENIEIILEFRKAGNTEKDIAEKYGMDWGNFTRFTRQLGIQKTKPTNALKRLIAPPPEIHPVVSQHRDTTIEDPEFDRMMSYIALAKKTYGVSLSPRDYNEFLKNTSSDKRFVPRYRRPKVLSPKQVELVETIVNSPKKIIFVEGDQRTGKTTGCFVGIHELVMKFDRAIKIDLMAGKGGQGGKGGATRILGDLYRDLILQEANDQLIAYKTNSFIEYWNGSRIIAHETTVADIKGSDSEVAWCDEFDVAVRADPEAVMSLLLALRARTDLKIIISANMDTGVYRLVKSIFADPKWSQDIEFVTMTNEDAPWIEAAGNDELLMTISDALVGEEFTQRRFQNIDLGEGEIFNPHALQNAFDTYDQALIDIGMYKEVEDGQLLQIKQPLRVVIGVDPGHDHPTGVFIGAVYRDHIYEIFSFKRIGVSTSLDYKTQGKVVRLSRNQLIEKVALIAQEYGALIFCESNSGGKEWMDDWNSYPNVRAYPSNFGGRGTKNDEFAYIFKLAQLIEEGRFHFKNPDLYKEAVIYDPRINKNERKGNLVDATLHCVWHLLRVNRKKRQVSFSQYQRG